MECLCIHLFPILFSLVKVRESMSLNLELIQPSLEKFEVKVERDSANNYNFINLQ